MKRTILHLIHSLGRGGAETMLIKALKSLQEYNNVVVTLFDDDRLGKDLICDKYISMNLPSLKHLPVAIPRLKKIIRENKPDIVHTHLIWPTVIARLATPAAIPLITTIHTSIATAPDYKKWYIRGLDRYTYNFRKSIIIGVSNTALNDYFSFLNIKPFRSYVLYTFVDLNQFHKQAHHSTSRQEFKVISTGSFRAAKNFPFLIRAFSLLKQENIVLHIYGSGALKESYQKLIEETGANVVLKGEVHNIEEVLPDYDLYTMSSVYEGFSLAVLEAMAVKLPMLMSDIPSFREQLEDTALFFDLKDEAGFADKLLWMKEHRVESLKMAERSFEKVQQNFTLPHHMEKLKLIYKETLSLF